jgi:hypothetical protein
VAVWPHSKTSISQHTSSTGDSLGQPTTAAHLPQFPGWQLLVKLQGQHNKMTTQWASHSPSGSPTGGQQEPVMQPCRHTTPPPPAARCP